MKDMNIKTQYQTQNKRRKFQLCEHPWFSLITIILISIAVIYISGTLIFGLLDLPEENPSVQFAHGMIYHFLTLFIIAPFLLRLPKGKRTFNQYLEDIGLSRVKPMGKLVLLAVSCYLILAISQAAASIVYRLFESWPINWRFIRQVFDLSSDLPPKSGSMLVAIPSSLEEVAFRGIVLTVFLNKYRERESIIFSSVGFGMIHLLNLASGRELVWVLGQVVWAFTIGLFYGYVFLRTKSLLPSMVVHYLGNVFIGSLTGYLQSRASIEIQALYGVVFSFGVIPTTLMIFWTRFFASKWFSDMDIERVWMTGSEIIKACDDNELS
jgi:membrane protease YdiL (CAAX protease family)